MCVPVSLWLTPLSRALLLQPEEQAGQGPGHTGVCGQPTTPRHSPPCLGHPRAAHGGPGRGHSAAPLLHAGMACAWDVCLNRHCMWYIAQAGSGTGLGIFVWVPVTWRPSPHAAYPEGASPNLVRPPLVWRPLFAGCRPAERLRVGHARAVRERAAQRIRPARPGVQCRRAPRVWRLLHGPAWRHRRPTHLSQRGVHPAWLLFSARPDYLQ